MPYVAKKDREILDNFIDKLSEYIISELTKGKKTAEISIVYRHTIKKMANTILELEKTPLEQRKAMYDSKNDPAEIMGAKIVQVADSYGYKADFDGELNYSITRLIQTVPKKMAEKGEWKEPFRYWVYAQTVGALTRSALDINRMETDPKNEWIIDGIVGTLFDIKDEYKRRVNTAYEAVQIERNGDCYDTPYRTELKKVDGGYQEVMKDYRDMLSKK